MRRTIELSMIVNNGAAGLPRCLDSVKPLVNRIVIGDTGSTDASVAIAKSYGAVVLDVPWTEDYAAARNRVLAQAECDWVLVLDPDEELDPSALTLLPSLVESREADAYQSWIWNYVDSLDYRAGGEPARINTAALGRAARYPAYFRSRNTRLFRRDLEIYFEHAVHETVLDRLVKLGRKRVHAPFVIHHFGYVEDPPQVRIGKTSFYRKLSARKAEAEPENSWAQLEMGMHELDCGKDYPSALPYLLKACALNPLSAAAWLYAGICFLRLNDHEKARLALQRSWEIDPENPLVHASLGDLAFAEGRYGEARGHFLQARKLGDASPLCLAKLGSSQVRLGFSAAGMEHLQQAQCAAPHSAEILDVLSIAALLCGYADQAKSAVARRLSLGAPNCFGSIVAASIYLHLGSNAEAAAVLAEALKRFPEDRRLVELASSAALVPLALKRQSPSVGPCIVN